jgi:cytochrome oxidase assembly protein ShyY1
VFSTLRQRRYLGLFGICAVIALVCAGAGTWQIARFDHKHRANHALRANNSSSVADVGRALGPAAAPTSTGKAQQFRHVTAHGVYLAEAQTLVRGQTVNGDVGYVVVTPLRTDSGVLLVARGFVAQTQSAATTPTVAGPPFGEVAVTGRLQPGETRADRYGRLPADQVESVNPAEQARRLSAPVWDAYAELLDGQPGTAGLTPIPGPDLSNPAGGAEEPQHAAYVVQWYLFAGLALALPFVLARAERRRDSDPDPHTPSLDDRLAGRA